MRQFAVTIGAILLLFFLAFVFISLPGDLTPEHFKFALTDVFTGFTFAIGLYHLFLYAFASRERYFLLFAITCLPIITRFGTMEGGIAGLLMSGGAMPASRHISEVSLIVFYIMSIWFMHELLRLKWGGFAIRAVYVAALGLPLILTAITGEAAGRWWAILSCMPYIIVIIKGFADERCRKNPYVVFYLFVTLCTLTLPVVFLLPFMPAMYAPLIPFLLMTMLVQAVLISYSYGESKRREQQLAVEKERIGAELNVATQIQANMLPCTFPAFPDRGEFDIYASMTPAKEVGGDFYDFFLVDERTLAIVMADVSGKGVPAALFMVIAKTLIKNNAQSGQSPKEVFETVNNILCENNDAGMFVTVFLGYLDIPGGRLTFVNAGHNYPLLRSGESFDWLKTKPNFILAGMEDSFYKQHEAVLKPGDELFLYTDGVTEAVNNENELFGDQKLIEAANDSLDLPLKDFTVSIKREIDKFAQGAEQADDITMLALRYKGEEVTHT
jgi:serine phosphatase RsbU (regulator of sigma subunit)